MSSLLASRLYVCRGEFPSLLFTQPCRRASIHFWHSICHESPQGQTKLINYEDLEVPDIESQHISLWSGRRHLGLVPVKHVINEHLGPGTMLSLRGDPPDKKGRAVAPESYEYELRRIRPSTSPGFKRGQLSVPLGAKSLWLDASIHPSRLNHLLDGIYRYLDPDSGAAGGPAEFPVECHIKARPRPGLTGLSLFTWGRLDLHPAVILRAMPRGSFQVLAPKVDFNEGHALWVIAPRDLRIGSAWLPERPHDVASVVERVFVRKKEWLKELIDSGDMTPNGELTAQGKLSPP